MIKEKQKITKYNYKKPKSKILFEYVRTFFLSILVSIIITSGLALHSRNEMLKNLYISSADQDKLDQEIAIKLISQQNLLKDLNTKSYAVCIKIGDLYMSAGDYIDAQKAYELAVLKSPKKVYKAHYKLLLALLELENFEKAFKLLNNIDDHSSVNLIKFKTRAYIVIGDKYYSLSKFISAVRNYEKANYYYSKFNKNDKKIVKAIRKRIVESYINIADLMVKAGRNSDALRFLRKAEIYMPEDFDVRYKTAIILTDFDPEKAIKYFEELFEEIPQKIDYGVYCTALMKAANIADLEGRTSQAKYYRYKIHSLDLFLDRKVLYKNDIDILIKKLDIKKNLFGYNVDIEYEIQNISNIDIINLQGEFILSNDKDNGKEIVNSNVANKNKPLFIYDSEPNLIKINFKKKFWTKKELDDYKVTIYLYKDKRFKTLILQHKLRTIGK